MVKPHLSAVDSTFLDNSTKSYLIHFKKYFIV